MAGGSVENGHLDGGAEDGAVVQARGCKAADCVGQWRNAVHEDPEPGQAVGRLQDAVEGEHQTEQGSGDVPACFGVGKRGDDEVCKGRGEDVELHGVDHEEPTLKGGLVEAEDGPVDAGPGDDAEDDLVRYFDEDVCQ